MEPHLVLPFLDHLAHLRRRGGWAPPVEFRILAETPRGPGAKAAVTER